MGKLGYKPALDGVRGVAVALVVVGHVLHGVWPHQLTIDDTLLLGGGIVGVQLFFALSGWLITTLLIERTGEPVGRFYGRRIRRLYPLLLVLVVVNAVVFWRRPQIVTESVVAATYLANLTALTGLAGGMLSHAWTLAVEEQFYAVWPWIAGRLHIVKVGVIALGAGVATVVLRTVLDVDPYYLLRWDAIAFGAAFAVFQWKPARWMTVAGWVVLAFWSQVGGVSNLVLTSTALAGAVVVAGSVDASWLSKPVLVYLGRRSYGLYLWHLWFLRFDLPPVLMLAVSLLAAEVTWRFVETRWHKPPSVFVEGGDRPLSKVA